MDNEPPLFAEPEEPGEADEFEEPAPSRSGTGRSGSGHLSGSGRSGSGPAAARPMVRRRSLVSGVVKAKRANEEAEIEGLTEEQLIKAGKSFASYLLFLVIFSVTAAPRLPPPACRLPPAACRLPPAASQPIPRRARQDAPCAARAHAASSAPRQVVVFSPRSSHDFWANTAMKQLLVEKRFHFGTLASGTPAAPHEKTLQDVHTHEQFFYWLKAPFLDALFVPEPGGEPLFLHGYNRVIGPARLRQVRVRVRVRVIRPR